MNRLLIFSAALALMGCGDSAEDAPALQTDTSVTTGGGSGETTGETTTGGETVAGETTEGSTTEGSTTEGSTTEGETTGGESTAGGGSTDWEGLPTDILKGDCTDKVVIDIDADEAVLDGWETTDSSFEFEGVVVFGPENTADFNGSATFVVDAPCSDTFVVWVRGRDEGSEDSHYVMVDGEPDPPHVFEVDCTGEGAGYKWTRLNQRIEGEPVCTYITDPWTHEWEAGEHEVTFFRREFGAVSRIIVTNDPDLVPGEPGPQ